jgi:YgiT-type zinc finger domain-containing protein
MTGEREKTNRCPLCGGRLKRGLAAMPFLLRDAVVLIKDVPAEICANCHEPFTSSKATDGIVGQLSPLRDLRAEVLVLSYAQLQAVPVSAPMIAG